jgi:hypothetical protein
MTRRCPRVLGAMSRKAIVRASWRTTWAGSSSRTMRQKRQASMDA